jgi:hypothetical protein
MPKVLNKKVDGVPEGAVFCGRGSPWGNPFKLLKPERDGDRDRVCDLFEKYILPHLDVSPLKGKDLVCFCAPKRCHCDALLAKANRE